MNGRPVRCFHAPREHDDTAPFRYEHALVLFIEWAARAINVADGFLVSYLPYVFRTRDVHCTNHHSVDCVRCQEKSRSVDCTHHGAGAVCNSERGAFEVPYRRQSCWQSATNVTRCGRTVLRGCVQLDTRTTRMCRIDRVVHAECNEDCNIGTGDQTRRLDGSV